MARAKTLAQLRVEIDDLEAIDRERHLTSGEARRLKRLKNRYSQQKMLLPMQIRATRDKLVRLEAAYYG